MRKQLLIWLILVAVILVIIAMIVKYHVEPTQKPIQLADPADPIFPSAPASNPPIQNGVTNNSNNNNNPAEQPKAATSAMDEVRNILPGLSSVESASIPEPSAGACDISQAAPVIGTYTQNLKPEVLKLALEAYNCAVKSGLDKQKLLTIIDYTLPSNVKRLWVLDLGTNQLLFTTWVAHGKNSGDVLPTKFSNIPESRQSSIGLFVTGHIYQGKHGASLKLYGLDKGFNDKAEPRAIVMHAAPYVNKHAAAAGRIGRSWGCPAVPPIKAKTLIPALADGSLVFSYYPDPKWLKESKYLHCGGK